MPWQHFENKTPGTVAGHFALAGGSLAELLDGLTTGLKEHMREFQEDNPDLSEGEIDAYRKHAPIIRGLN